MKSFELLLFCGKIGFVIKEDRSSLAMKLRSQS